MVPMGRFELPTSPLPRECSTPELHGQNFIRFGAGEGNRTLVISLEGFCSTIELHPPLKVAILQNITTDASRQSNDGGGRRIRTFEAFATDLQSAPFDRSGIPPFRKTNLYYKNKIKQTSSTKSYKLLIVTEFTQFLLKILPLIYLQMISGSLNNLYLHKPLFFL